jgi:lysyl-tRNA synthetase class 1
MSSSKGIVLLPEDLLRILPPDALRRMMLGRDPARAIELDLGEGFPRFVDEYNAETGGTDVPFNHLVLVAQTAGDDAEAAGMLRRGGYEAAARDLARLSQELSYARNWARERAPESLRLRVLDPDESAEAAAGLDEEQRTYLSAVAEKLSPDMDGEAVQEMLYSTAIGREIKPKKAFAAVYTVLLGKKSGPKAGPFVAGLPDGIVRERFLASLV